MRMSNNYSTASPFEETVTSPVSGAFRVDPDRERGDGPTRDSIRAEET